jgi:hypothetical protein
VVSRESVDDASKKGGLKMPFGKEYRPRNFHRGRTFSVYLDYPLTTRAEAIKKRYGFNDQDLLKFCIVTFMEQEEADQERRLRGAR